MKEGREEGGKKGGEVGVKEYGHRLYLSTLRIQEASMSFQTLWGHELLSCDIHTYHLTLSQHLSLACLKMHSPYSEEADLAWPVSYQPTTEIVEHSNGL